MPRPVQCRRVGHTAPCGYFKPAGIPLRDLQEVQLAVEELEALRLADLEGLYQEQASERMGVSRATFGRIVEAARRKVAEALVHGKAIAIQGGHFAMEALRRFACSACGHEWDLPFGTGRPPECPACKSGDFTRIDDGRGGRGGRCHGRGRGTATQGTPAAEMPVETAADRKLESSDPSPAGEGLKREAIRSKGVGPGRGRGRGGGGGQGQGGGRGRGQGGGGGMGGGGGTGGGRGRG